MQMEYIHRSVCSPTVTVTVCRPLEASSALAAKAATTRLRRSSEIDLDILPAAQQGALAKKGPQTGCRRRSDYLTDRYTSERRRIQSLQQLARPPPYIRERWPRTCRRAARVGHQFDACGRRVHTTSARASVMFSIDTAGRRNSEAYQKRCRKETSTAV